MRRQFRPMLATLVDEPFDSPDWVYETKYDGYRLITAVKDGEATLYSRSGKDVSEKYELIRRAFKGYPHEAVFDGELCALDKKGRSRFQLLQEYAENRAPLRYYIFDLLFFDGRDMRRLPLLERKRVLRAEFPTSPHTRLSKHIAEKGVRFFNAAKKEGLEGVIAKRAQGLYYSGKRTREWLKFKAVMEQEVVIVGYTPPQGSRVYFGSLVLAVRENGGWKYAGRAGTGFDREMLTDLAKKMRPLETHAKPIKEKVPEESATTWVKPKLVCEIKFTEWTKAGEMRHPVFLGLRDDKKPEQVRRERPV